MSVDSTDYRYLKYTKRNASVNHPNFDSELDSSFSSIEHVPTAHSRTRSVAAISRNGRSSANESQKAKSFLSEPARKKPIMPLTEQVLAIHNRTIAPYRPLEYPETNLVEQSLLERVDERCKNITQEFDDKITKLETQFAKAELEFSQTRCDIEELNAMEKEYLNQGIQTDLVAKDIQDGNAWKQKAEVLEDFVDQTRKIIWDTSFIPLSAVCRQLPTEHDDEDDEDICDYHRKKIERLRLKSERERQSYYNDDKATLQRISNWSKALQHH